jgi:hypothetical protein
VGATEGINLSSLYDHWRNISLEHSDQTFCRVCIILQGAMPNMSWPGFQRFHCGTLQHVLLKGLNSTKIDRFPCSGWSLPHEHDQHEHITPSLTCSRRYIVYKLKVFILQGLRLSGNGGSRHCPLGSQVGQLLVLRVGGGSTPCQDLSWTFF